MIVSRFVATRDVALQYDHIEVLSYVEKCAEAMLSEKGCRSLDEWKDRLTTRMRPMGAFEIAVFSNEGFEIETLVEAQATDGLVVLVRTTNPTITIH